jgi:hypothetical protein
VIQEQVDKLLAAKAAFKTLTGTDYQPAAAASTGTKPAVVAGDLKIDNIEQLKVMFSLNA